MEHVKHNQFSDESQAENGHPNPYHYENEADRESNILTKKYVNGSVIKQAVLPKTGRVAVVRSLKAKDMTEATRLMDKDPEAYMMAIITVATSFDEKKMTIEDVAELPLKDYQLLVQICSDLNF